MYNVPPHNIDIFWAEILEYFVNKHWIHEIVIFDATYLNSSNCFLTPCGQKLAQKNFIALRWYPRIVHQRILHLLPMDNSITLQLAGKTMATIQLDKYAKGIELKKEAAKHVNIPFDCMKILLAGKYVISSHTFYFSYFSISDVRVLKDDLTLEEQGVKNNAKFMALKVSSLFPRVFCSHLLLILSRLLRNSNAKK